jgi:hypothetical protein
MLSIIMQHYNALYHYAKCRVLFAIMLNAECRYAGMLSVVMLSVTAPMNYVRKKFCRKVDCLSISEKGF